MHRLKTYDTSRIGFKKKKAGNFISLMVKAQGYPPFEAITEEDMGMFICYVCMTTCHVCINAHDKGCQVPLELK